MAEDEWRLHGTDLRGAIDRLSAFADALKSEADRLEAAERDAAELERASESAPPEDEPDELAISTCSAKAEEPP